MFQYINEPTSLKMSLADHDYGDAAAASDGAEMSVRRRQLRANHVPVLTRSQSQRQSPRVSDSVFRSASLSRASVADGTAAPPTTNDTADVSTTMTSLRDAYRLDARPAPGGSNISIRSPDRRPAQSPVATHESLGKLRAARSSSLRSRGSATDGEKGVEVEIDLRGARRRTTPVEETRAQRSVRDIVADEVQKVMEELRQQLLAQHVGEQQAQLVGPVTNREAPLASPPLPGASPVLRRPTPPLPPRPTSAGTARDKARPVSSRTSRRTPSPVSDSDSSSDGRTPKRTRRETARARGNHRRGVASVRSNEHGIYMPTFDGTDWITFRIQFDTFCERYQLSDAERLSRLKLALEGPAARVLHSCEPSMWTLATLMNDLETRYGQSKSYPIVERELRRVHRRPNQTLQDLHDEILAIARKADMDETQRCKLTRSAFMGALDDDIKLIHFIDKHDPERESMASALKYAIQYERENGLTPDAAPARADVRPVTDELMVSAYGQGPSPLMKQVERNAQALDTITGLLGQLTQTMHTFVTAGGKGASKSQQDKGQVWPGSRYKGKNFIPNYKPPGKQQDDDQQDAQQSRHQDSRQDHRQSAGEPTHQLIITSSAQLLPDQGSMSTMQAAPTAAQSPSA